MTNSPAPAPLDNTKTDHLAELLRQSLAGLAPADPLNHFLDRLEGRK